MRLRNRHAFFSETAYVKGNRVRHLASHVLLRSGTRDAAGKVILRHTFCSLLAMRGAPARAIQELAGHADLTMTQRYMHLSPAALDEAIRLLDRPKSTQKFGDVVETGSRT
jgi:site-specific recombinase XerD